MHYQTFRPITVSVFVITASLLATGCGGAGGDTAAVADASTEASALRVTAKTPAPTASAAAGRFALKPQTPVAPPPSYTVLPDELVTNGQFNDGLNNWSIIDAFTVASELRPGGMAMSVGYQALQTLAGTSLAPGKSYTLIVKARNLTTTASTQLAMSFTRAGSTEQYRTYTATVASTAYQDYKIEFTAPAYTAVPKITFTTNGTSRTVIDSVSLKMRAAIVQTEPVASSANSYVPAGYALAFNDEFNGTSLNRSKWFTRYVYAGGTLDYLNDEQERYRDNNNHGVANGVLSLTARKVASNANGINYESGMIRSDWTSRYGYYEARVKMPGGLGVWPAFWLNSDVSSTGALSWPPEIDIFEFVNNGVEDTTNMLHSGVHLSNGATSPVLYADPMFNTQWTYYVAPYNFNDGWHTIGAEWDATTVTMYIDGKKIYTRGSQWKYDSGADAGPAHIILNLAIGGSWAGRHGIDDLAFPQAMQVDWVRAYSKVN